MATICWIVFLCMKMMMASNSSNTFVLQKSDRIKLLLVYGKPSYKDIVYIHTLIPEGELYERTEGAQFSKVLHNHQTTFIEKAHISKYLKIHSDQILNMQVSIFHQLFRTARDDSVALAGKITEDIHSFSSKYSGKYPVLLFNVLWDIFIPSVYCYRRFCESLANESPLLIIKLTECSAYGIVKYVMQLHQVHRMIVFRNPQHKYFSNPFGVGEHIKLVLLTESLKEPSQLRNYNFFVETLKNFFEGDSKDTRNIYEGEDQLRSICVQPYPVTLTFSLLEEVGAHYKPLGSFRLFWAVQNNEYYPSLLMLRQDCRNAKQKISYFPRKFVPLYSIDSLGDQIQDTDLLKLSKDIVTLILIFLYDDGGFNSLRLSCKFFCNLPCSEPIDGVVMRRAKLAAENLTVPVANLTEFIAASVGTVTLAFKNRTAASLELAVILFLVFRSQPVTLGESLQSLARTDTFSRFKFMRAYKNKLVFLKTVSNVNKNLEAVFNCKGLTLEPIAMLLVFGKPKKEGLTKLPSWISETDIYRSNNDFHHMGDFALPNLTPAQEEYIRNEVAQDSRLLLELRNSITKRLFKRKPDDKAFSLIENAINILSKKTYKKMIPYFTSLLWELCVPSVRCFGRTPLPANISPAFEISLPTNSAQGLRAFTSMVSLCRFRTEYRHPQHLLIPNPFGIGAHYRLLVENYDPFTDNPEFALSTIKQYAGFKDVAKMLEGEQKIKEMHSRIKPEPYKFHLATAQREMVIVKSFDAFWKYDEATKCFHPSLYMIWNECVNCNKASRFFPFSTRKKINFEGLTLPDNFTITVKLSKIIIQKIIQPLYFVAGFNSIRLTCKAFSKLPCCPPSSGYSAERIKLRAENLNIPLSRLSEFVAASAITIALSFSEPLIACKEFAAILFVAFQCELKFVQTTLAEVTRSRPYLHLLKLLFLVDDRVAASIVEEIKTAFSKLLI